MLDQNFGGVIWTNHALERLSERGIKQGDAYVAFRYPDNSRYASNKKAWIYYKTWGNTTIEVVASQDERKQWVIMSVWSRYTDPRGGDKKTKVDPLWKLIFRFISRKIRGETTEQ